jgi:DNA repair exonuclease SbcCD ATPase subunit
MISATGLMIEFAYFLQIISFIIVPVLGIVILLTIIQHYRRKKRKAKAADPSDGDSSLLNGMPVPGMPDGKGAYLLFDHSGLIRQYRNKLSYNHARYAALRQDFEKLELKYAAALQPSNTPFNNTKKNEMENTPAQWNATIQKMAEEHAEEKKELLNRMEQLDRSYKSLETENESLLEQIGMQSATGDEKAIVVNRWKEENDALKQEVKEQQYLRDLVDEKKAQIDFLQNQLDQRIRNFYQAEQQRKEVLATMEQTSQRQQEMAAELETASQELQRNRELVAQLQQSDMEKEALINDNQQLLHAKSERLIFLENTLQEIREQNEMLNAAVADSQDRAGIMQQQMEDMQQRVIAAEQKLNANKQVLSRLYKEFTSCMNDENETSPIVTLRPSYISKVDDEWEGVGSL